MTAEPPTWHLGSASGGLGRDTEVEHRAAGDRGQGRSSCWSPRRGTRRSRGSRSVRRRRALRPHQPARADLDPASGHARLSYRRAADLFHTATGGWTLHQLRHSRLTHLAEAGVQLRILMAKSRHTSLTSLTVYAQPTFDAVAAATAALDPDRRR